ncbi:MAG TPA: RsmE family RNA methyltransferase, partial [Candidatus Omnitrophota bacterium]|nr:RsmE family RNA methyltransferase [Candidatus Omnitrophota bacterium]
MPRFYSPNADFSLKKFILADAEELHHLKNVLRIKKGEKIVLFNGKNEEAEGIIREISSQNATIEIFNVKRISSRNTPKIILACAIPKKSKFEIIIEKCTELGVDEIIPIITKRTEIALKDERADKKLTRYKTIAISAAKQSHRLTIPEIHPIMTFSDAMENLSQNTTVLIPSLMGKPQNLFKTIEGLRKTEKISFFIGPEGDFTPEE